MKHYWTLFTLFIFLVSCKAQTQKSVDYGFINLEWTYKNDGLNLEYPLLRNWYFLNAPTETLIRVGSDVKNIKAYTAPLHVPIDEFKMSNSDKIATLFAITKLDTSSTIVAKEFDYNADKVITVGLVYSDNSDVYSFLRNTCVKCDDTTFKKIILRNVILGNINFDGYITSVRDRDGRKIGHFFGVKRFGSLYLVCQYNFPDLNSFETYKENFKKLTIK